MESSFVELEIIFTERMSSSCFTTWYILRGDEVIHDPLSSACKSFSCTCLRSITDEATVWTSQGLHVQTFDAGVYNVKMMLISSSVLYP